MGYIGTFGTATTAPEHHCNTFGTPSWSGKHEDDFTSVLEQELREFIKREAKRYGNNDLDMLPAMTGIPEYRR
ncbi:hypothetical protein ACRN96_18355 [Shewanella oncorhynchi]|uniref:hypothetical protein n=2 Tax=Shewanella TaxID=22 RepID=UPI003D7A9C29